MPDARKMTFEEFVRLPEEDTAYELVDGKRVPLKPATMRHGSTQMQLAGTLGGHLGDDFGGFLGIGLHFPTIPFFGRRGDVVYLAPEHVSDEDWDRGYPLHPPGLVIEVLSEGAERRDTHDKRLEYARAGVARYWIVNPKARTVEMLMIGPQEEYVLERFLCDGDTLTSPLFPGLRIPLRRIFVK